MIVIKNVKTRSCSSNPIFLKENYFKKNQVRLKLSGKSAFSHFFVPSAFRHVQKNVKISFKPGHFQAKTIQILILHNRIHAIEYLYDHLNSKHFLTPFFQYLDCWYGRTGSSSSHPCQRHWVYGSNSKSSIKKTFSNFSCMFLNPNNFFPI